MARLRAVVVIQPPGFGGIPRRPLLGGDREGFRHRVLGEVDVAEDADQGGGAAAGFASEDGVEGRQSPCIGRTSIGPLAGGGGLAGQVERDVEVRGLE